MTNQNFASLLILGLVLTVAVQTQTLQQTFSLYNTPVMVSSQLTYADPVLTAESPLFAMPLALLAPTPILACQDHEVQNSQSVCIKPQYIEGCEIYETVSTCNKCSNGYLLNKNKLCDFQSTFTGLVTHLRGCILQFSSECHVCAEGFYLKDTKCQLGVKHCTTYNADGQCTECEADYSLVLLQCRRNNLLGCKYETSSHTCQECYAPFKLNGQHCDIEQCRIMNDYGCVHCECGYYLTPERDCKPIATGCLRYEKGICKDCLAHYKLKGGVCQIEGCIEYSGNYCKRCSDKYDLVDGQCNFKNCNDWLNDQCISCKEGYGLSSGLCVKAAPVQCQ